MWKVSKPASIADLKNHALIGFDQETSYIRNMQKRGLPLTRDMFSLFTDNQVALVKRNPELLPVLPQAVASELETWIVMHEDLRSSERCRIVFDALASGVSGYIAEEN
ncbi:MAG: hypothetical protein NVS3B11_21900 [Collimonas sp.]